MSTDADPVAGWVLVVDFRDGSFADASAAIREVLVSHGVDPESVDPKDIRIDIGSYRGDQPSAPYFRGFVREDVLPADDPERAP